MEVHVLCSMVISPCRSQTEITEMPLNVFDMLASNTHMAVLYAFMPPVASNAALKEGLSKALLLFPTLAGRLVENDRGRQFLSMGGNGGGVMVVETKVGEDLVDILPLKPSPELMKLHPPIDGAQHLLQVQLNRFACGGLLVGLTAHHRVADGKSMSSFFVEWGKLVRGLHVDKFPVYDQTMLAPRDPPRCDHNHWENDFEPHAIPPSSSYSYEESLSETNHTLNITVHYSEEFISKIKAQMLRKHSTFEVLLAHLWKNVTKARGLESETLTQIRVAVNARPRLRPSASPEFFGNLVINAYPRAKAKELMEGRLAYVAGLVHDAVRRADDGYIRSLIDFGAMTIDRGHVLVPVTDLEGLVLCPNLEVNSWLGFPFHEVDFGFGGELCGFVPTWMPVEGVVYLMPTLHGDGGVDVLITLFEDHARLFREISHSLD